jgi:hypothetical protein
MPKFLVIPAKAGIQGSRIEYNYHHLLRRYIDSMSQLPCLSNVACEEVESDKWLAEGHVFSVIDSEDPEVHPP